MSRKGIAPMALLLVSCALLSACAGTAGHARAELREDSMRDADLDVLFATEFPVANKEEALAQGHVALRSGDTERALFFYVKAVRFDPADSRLMVMIGQLHEYRKDPALAIRAYSLALHSNPDEQAALEGRGLLLLEAGELLYAEKDLRRAVMLDSRAWRSWNGLGLLADKQGAHAEAVGKYTAALDLRPDLPELLNNRGYSYLLAGDTKRAEGDLAKAAALGYAKAWINLGALFGRNSQYDEAVEAYSQVLTEAEALNRAGTAALEKRHYDIAEKLLRQAVESSPVYFVAAEEQLARLDELR